MFLLQVVLYLELYVSVLSLNSGSTVFQKRLVLAYLM